MYLITCLIVCVLIINGMADIITIIPSEKAGINNPVRKTFLSTGNRITERFAFFHSSDFQIAASGGSMEDLTTYALPALHNERILHNIETRLLRVDHKQNEAYRFGKNLITPGYSRNVNGFNFSVHPETIRGIHTIPEPPLYSLLGVFLVVFPFLGVKKKKNDKKDKDRHSVLK